MKRRREIGNAALLASAYRERSQALRLCRVLVEFQEPNAQGPRRRVITLWNTPYHPRWIGQRGDYPVDGSAEEAFVLLSRFLPAALGAASAMYHDISRPLI
ncbi:hypothetical protein BN2476_740093 [Paraburkholderia piptadeniae]|uniref:Uncharacterized protein n=1 Tax=Paraburkholderia piptadeniae TaxID=1701573 RepID=A0A1N7SRU6_9BURK|nr:hypothetical protein BN2476_740093 [Paraburkholderia piptadeniae]